MKKVWYWVIGIVLAVVIIGNFLPDDSSNSFDLTGSVIEDSQKYSNEERENYLGRDLSFEQEDYYYQQREEELRSQYEQEAYEDELREQERRDQYTEELQRQLYEDELRSQYEQELYEEMLREQQREAYEEELRNQQRESQEQSNYFTVTRVIDGDTIEINTGERVRLICIDTPETYEDGYQEAKDYLTNLILNKEVYLKKDISETDRYGRLLRYIYTKEVCTDLANCFINLRIVLQGYGRAYPYSPDTTLCPQIQTAEGMAKENKLGIWAEIQQEEASSSDSGYTCSYNAYNCDDFSTHTEAQYVFDGCGGVNNDVHKLDRDQDGLACETLP